MKTWVFQDTRQKQKLGRNAPWSVGWYEAGRRRSKRIGSKRDALAACESLEAGSVSNNSPWAHAVKAIRNSWTGSRDGLRITVNAMKNYARLTKAQTTYDLNSPGIALFAARRLQDKVRCGGVASPATVNKELRSLKAASRRLVEMGFLLDAPVVRMVREVKRDPRFVPEAVFGDIMREADPWWRGLLTFLWLTGWRIGEAMDLRWRDISLERQAAITRDNKGKREEWVPLHPAILAQLTPGAPMDFVFARSGCKEALWHEFHALQQRAGVRLECHRKHDHRDSCTTYGFHDLRRSFASYNASRLSATELQVIMRHKTFTTTQKYINIGMNSTAAVTAKLHLPGVLMECHGSATGGQKSDVNP